MNVEAPSPRPPSILGARAKLQRARQHFKALEVQVRRFFADGPYSVVVHPDPERGLHSVRLRDPKDLPLVEWALLIGDCVHNTRCALDYVAWELAGADPNDRRTLFPLHDNPTKFQEVGKGRIKRLPENAQADIERLQPYNQAGIVGCAVHDHALWALEVLDVNDKHKLLTLAVARPTDGHVLANPRLDGTAILVEPRTAFPFIDGAEIMTIRVSPFQADLALRADLAIDVAFDADLGTGTRQFVLPGLARIIESVETVVSYMDQAFFQPHPTP